MRKSASARSPTPPAGAATAGNAQSYYQAMSLVKLGQADEAKKIFQALVDSANELRQPRASTTDTDKAPERQQSRRSRHRPSRTIWPVWDISG